MSPVRTPPGKLSARAEPNEKECEEAPDDEHQRTSIPRAWAREGQGSGSGSVSHVAGLLRCGAEPEPTPNSPEDQKRAEPPRSGAWGSTSPGSMMRALPGSCRGGSEHPAAPGDVNAAPSAASKGASMDLRFTSPCRQPKVADGPSPAPSSKSKLPCRTLKYYPPPLDNTDQSVDVIDHGSEVLVIRREPSVPPRILQSAAEPCGARGGVADFKPHAQQQAEAAAQARANHQAAVHPHAAAPPRAHPRLPAADPPDTVAGTPEADATI
mmetsp:Transcript_41576/g.129563  ORF Transcript_41576/g.129563 Transcript_41576/m.129563 type:complete len:268 (+) Transcript_41576:126-929(+)